MTSIDDLLKFATLLHRLHGTERTAITPPNCDRFENSAEHTYQVTMLAWYVMMKENLKLDTEKVLKYALVHDLIEAYTGDTAIHDEEGRKTKEARETQAFETFSKEFPELGDIQTLVEQYEALADEESKFVYGIDKLIDPINNSLNDMQPSRSEGWDMDLTKKLKKDKVTQHPVAARLFEEWILHVHNTYPDF